MIGVQRSIRINTIYEVGREEKSPVRRLVEIGNMEVKKTHETKNF